MIDKAAAVADFMTLFGQPVRSTPTTNITEDEQILRAKLVLEEALEFVEAMGVKVSWHDGEVTGYTATSEIDLVEALDALADITVVTEGSAHTLGADLDHIFGIVHQTNMAKASPDGSVRRDEHGKVLKPDGWAPPTSLIGDYIERASGGGQ